MEYRQLPHGSAKEAFGVLGLGMGGIQGSSDEEIEAVVRKALQNGINFFDLCAGAGNVYRPFGRAMAGQRERVFFQLHLGAVYDAQGAYGWSRDLDRIRSTFEWELQTLGTDYADFGFLHCVDEDEDFEALLHNGILDYAKQRKAAGRIRHIGFSSHNPVTAMKVIETGLPEMMLFSINPAFDLCPAELHVLDQLSDGFAADRMTAIDPTRADLYRMCAGRGIGITVMKTLGAGKLIRAEHTPFAKPLTVPQCIHYALGRPAVASVMLGCQTAAEVAEALRYLELPEAELDYLPVLSTLQQNFTGNCVYCSHCQPCPQGIDIAAVNRYLDIAKLDQEQVPPSIRSHYEGLATHGSDCIGCGSCEARCPFSVPVIERMGEAARIFGV